jgi:hypothetical protein
MMSRFPRAYLIPCIVALFLTLSASQVVSGQIETRYLSTANMSINGMKFEDLDGDGFWTEGEPGIAGWTIRLLQNGTELSNTATDTQGTYSFDNLQSDIYEVKEDTLPGWNQTTPGSGSYIVRLTDKSAYRLDFGNVRFGLAASLPMREYPLMHPSPEEVQRWIEQYNASPRAYLSPQVQAELGQAAGAEFSLLDHLQYTPSERNQGHCGNCWAWAGTGVMEIDNSVKNNIKDRLSIQYLNSNYHGGCGSSGACCGGWLSNVASFYGSEGYAIPWSNANAHWQDGGKGCGECTNVPASDISTNPNYPLASIKATTIPTRGTGKENAISNIKNVLHQGKAVWFGFFLPNSQAWSGFFNFWSNQPESAVWQPDFACGSQFNYNEGAGHAVLCLGYNDIDPNNRYWIMLNSWGTASKRPKGIFLVSMDMNYDCTYSGLSGAFYWMTLDMSYLPGTNNAPEVPDVPYGPGSGFSNNALTYTTSTTDPDGDRLKYTFNWGDGSTSETSITESGDDASSAHSWGSGGTYEVKAKATDAKGLSSDWSEGFQVTITQSPKPPITPSVPVGPTTGYSWSTYDYATSTMDPDGFDVKYIFDWGDGTTSETNFVPSGTAASASHSWVSPRSYYIRAYAIDSQGTISGWSGTKTVRIYANNPPATPSAPSGPSSGYIGAAHSFTASSTDPNRENVRYTFDWGDGSISETTFMKSGSKASAAHTWSAVGTYLVRARATDSRGASSEWSSQSTIDITTNRPPDTPSQPSGPKTGRIQTSFEYSTSAVDQDGDELKYTFDWGDGTTSETNLMGSGEMASAAHSWKTVGSYLVKAIATDSEGASSAWSNSLVVSISNVLNYPPNRPTTPTGPRKGYVGNSYAYLAYSRDPNGDQIRYIFDWGDGTTSETGFMGSGKSASASKSWETQGTYYVKVRAEDSGKASSSWSNSLAVKVY